MLALGREEGGTASSARSRSASGSGTLAATHGSKDRTGGTLPIASAGARTSGSGWRVGIAPRAFQARHAPGCDARAERGTHAHGACASATAPAWDTSIAAPRGATHGSPSACAAQAAAVGDRRSDARDATASGTAAASPSCMATK